MMMKLLALSVTALTDVTATYGNPLEGYASQQRCNMGGGMFGWSGINSDECFSMDELSQYHHNRYERKAGRKVRKALRKGLRNYFQSRDRYLDGMDRVMHKNYKFYNRMGNKLRRVGRKSWRAFRRSMNKASIFNANGAMGALGPEPIVLSQYVKMLQSNNPESWKTNHLDLYGPQQAAFDMIDETVKNFQGMDDNMLGDVNDVLNFNGFQTDLNKMMYYARNGFTGPEKTFMSIYGDMSAMGYLNMAFMVGAAYNFDQLMLDGYKSYFAFNHAGSVNFNGCRRKCQSSYDEAAMFIYEQLTSIPFFQLASEADIRNEMYGSLVMTPEQDAATAAVVSGELRTSYVTYVKKSILRKKQNPGTIFDQDAVEHMGHEEADFTVSDFEYAKTHQTSQVVPDF